MASFHCCKGFLLLLVVIHCVTCSHMMTSSPSSSPMSASTSGVQEYKFEFFDYWSMEWFSDNVQDEDRFCRNDLDFDGWYASFKYCSGNGCCTTTSSFYSGKIATGCCDGDDQCCANKADPNKCCNHDQVCCGNLEDSTCCSSNQECREDMLGNWECKEGEYFNAHFVWISLPVYWFLLIITIAIVASGSRRNQS